MPSLFKAGLSGLLTIFIATVSLTGHAAGAGPISLVITGTRTAQTADESLAPISVVTREEIEQRPNNTVTDLLRQTPGLTITSNGGKGTVSSLFLRGTESDQTLVLIDGVRVGSATTGTAALQYLSPDAIESVEIVRGPRSSLYGSEAIGGVIQIFTRKPETGSSANFAVSGGSHSSAGLNAGLSGRSDKGWYQANIASFTTDGFNACRGKPFPDGGGCFTDEPDDDGFSNTTFSASGGMPLGDRVNASVNALHIDSDAEFDGSFENEQEAVNQLLSGKLEISASDTWNIDLLAAVSKDHADNFKDGAFTSRFDTDRQQFTLQNDIATGSHGTTTIGLDYYNDEVSGTTDYVVDSRDNTGLFAQYLGSLSGLELQASLRNDDNEQFGSHSTGGLSIGQAFGSGMRWTASWGNAFKAPSFNELYFPGFGNPNLDAETSDSFDIGLSGRSGSTYFSANVFTTDIDAMIAYDAVGGRPVNVGRARINGIELALGGELGQWNIYSNLTLLAHENRTTGPNQGKQLARRPETAFNLGVQRDFGKLSTLIDLHTQGDSFDDLANTRKLDGFTTVNLNLGYAFNPDWSMNLAINNLFDEQYETAEYYNQDGINGLLTLRYRTH